jgi:16S rRNA G966 N2-methylase RsmD
MFQESLPLSKPTMILEETAAPRAGSRYQATRQGLSVLLASDLSFQGHNTSGGTHDFHAFPAKFPPQLPRVFIDGLTAPGESVLDPMMGSGTCVVEALAAGRVALGFDIDPLAILLGRVKTTPADAALIAQTGEEIAARAEKSLSATPEKLRADLAQRFEPKTVKFVDYWFSPQTQLELAALMREIERLKEPAIREFFMLAFSAVIITKSGGVSLAWDLAHTRPHKLKQGVAKTYRPALKEFCKRVAKNLNGLRQVPTGRAAVNFGNAEQMPLPDNSVDLLFTSPPYAANAIDYMRAHKFSLVWFGRSVGDLSGVRGQCIGGESVKDFNFAELPPETRRMVAQISALDAKRGASLRRYYSEMARVMAQARRVLRPGCAAVFVVGSAVMRGVDTLAAECLGELGEAQGLELAGIATRRLDRDKRLMPARSKAGGPSQIEERMHEEYIVALVKPEQP